MQNRRENASALRLYEIDRDADIEQHTAKLVLAANQHAEARTTALHWYSRDMAVDLDLARRETIRDIWVQRSVLNNTIMMLGSLLFAAAFENFTQAVLPQTSIPIPLWLLYVLNGTLGASVVACTLCIVLCIKVQGRLGWYSLDGASTVYTCGKSHATFNDYFDCHCEQLRVASVIAFLAGGTFVIVAALALQGIKYHVAYDDDASAYIFLGAVVLALGVMLLVARGYMALLPSADAGEGAAEDDFGGLQGATQEADELLDEQQMTATTNEGGDGDDGNERESYREPIFGTHRPLRRQLSRH